MDTYHKLTNKLKKLMFLLRGFARPLWRYIQKKKKINLYRRRYPIILDTIKKKERINVVFFVMNIGMWKSDYLFSLLMKDTRFNPCIVSFFYPNDSIEYQKYVQDSLSSYFSSKGFPYRDCYDFEKNAWLNLQTLNPDIIFYAQPYNCGYERYLIESLWTSSIFAYIPYCFQMEDIGIFHNLLLQNIAWKLFYPTKFHCAQEQKLNYNKGKNIAVCGYPMADYLLSKEDANPSIWPQKDHSIKRVIWAPHHTILSTDILHYSNFMEMAEPMLDLARKYEGRVQFAFKPHPRLMPKLYSLWGKDKTMEYYNAWGSSPNTTFVEGDYVDLFKSSDALIHDCSSFMGEYLYTGKPLMFVAKSHCEDVLNDFGMMCFKQHYKGDTIESIRKFIDNVVIGEIDPMKEERLKFFKEQLLPPNNCTVAQNIYNIMAEEFHQ